MTIKKEPISQEDAELIALAKTDIAFGPRYVEDNEGVFESNTSDLEKFFAMEDIQTSRVPHAEECWEIIERSASFPCILPVIIIGSACLSQNPALADAVITVVSNYVSDYFTRRPTEGKKKVTLKIIKGSTKITYDGAPEGLKEIKSILEEINDG